MDTPSLLALALDPARLLQAQGMDPDPWQRRLLLSAAPRILLMCSRGAGKSRTTSALALHTALFTPSALVLLVSRAQRQSLELFRYVKQGYSAAGRPIPTIKETESQIELANGSRIVSLPGKEETVRSFQGVTLLVIDEAARVPDDLYYYLHPMLAVSRGRMVCLTTPFGQRGFFWREWEGEAGEWQRILATWHDCPRISPEFIEQEKRSMGEAWVDQEYNCLFTALEGLVYPDFDRCKTICTTLPGRGDRLVGGIDWGFRNPFAALWGVLDRDDVFWINGERYLRETPLHEHPAAIKLARNTANHFYFSDVAGMLSKLLPASYNRAVWYISPTVVTDLLQLKDGANRAIFISIDQGATRPPVWKLLNLPVTITEKLPALGTTGAMLLVDPSLYVIGDCTVWVPDRTGTQVVVRFVERRNKGTSVGHKQVYLDRGTVTWPSRNLCRVGADPFLQPFLAFRLPAFQRRGPPLLVLPAALGIVGRT